MERKIPMLRFKVPQTCVICEVREETSEDMRRVDLNEFTPRELAKLPGKYLGQWVHKNPDCLKEIIKIIKSKST